jgi:hypothetical protein
MQSIPEPSGYMRAICRFVLFTFMLFVSRIGYAQDDTALADPEPSTVSDTTVATSRDLASLRLSPPTTRMGVSPTQTPQQGGRPQGSEIEREAKRLQAGVRAGVALDPELLMIGVQSQLGPIFRSNIWFRPSVEFGFGEVTAMFGFNGEFIYQLQRSSAQDRWAPYAGAGLGINLLHQNFERDGGGSRIDFGDFHSDTALNILAGARHRNGVFIEARTSIYSDPSPTLRLMVGYNF